MSDFFNNSDISQQQAEGLVSETLNKCDDGELFLENTKSESILLDDGKIKNSSFETSFGFGFRAVNEDKTAFSHSNIISKKSLGDAAKNLKANVRSNSENFIKQDNPQRTNTKLYEDKDPIESKPFEEKIELLQKIDNYVRQKNSSIKQVTASFFGEHQSIKIIKSNNQIYEDQRPLVRFNIGVMIEKNGKKESGSYGTGGRKSYDNFLGNDNWKVICDEAIRQAEVNLESKPAPAGEMKVVLGPGWPGIILHEAVGHGLEGDFNRKKTSAFHNLVGQKIAHENITVVDDGTISSRRGSLTIDDEGTPTSKNILIENGILKNFMQDRLNARLMNTRSTGSGRRENYRHVVLPRMRNTMMLSGKQTQDEMIRSVDKGIFAVSFGGGQVDITSGKFVFNCTEAYEIINGQIGSPIKGATLIGDGPSILKEVSMVGNDMKLDPGIGTCGKAGQGVPVGVAQPSILIDKMTVGGTKL